MTWGIYIDAGAAISMNFPNILSDCVGRLFLLSAFFMRSSFVLKRGIKKRTRHAHYVWMVKAILTVIS